MAPAPKILHHQLCRVGFSVVRFYLFLDLAYMLVEQICSVFVWARHQVASVLIKTIAVQAT